MATNMYIPIAFKSDPRGLKKAESDLEKFKKVVKGVAIAVAASAAAMTAGMVAFGVEAVKAADESRQIARTLSVAVKNSKAFGSTADEIQKVTDALQAGSTTLGELTGLDDEVIAAVKRNWLSVPRIVKLGVAGINKLALTAADVAAGTGKEFEAVAQAFVKAFGDPKGAIAKLQKAGVILADNEKERYALLIKQGKQQQALAFLADTLNKKYEGQATALASPFKRLQVIWQNFMEDVGTAFLPIIDKALPQITAGLKKLAIDPKFQKALADMGNMLAVYIPKALTWLVDNMPRLSQIIKTTADALTRLADLLFPDQQKQQAALKNVNFGKMDKLAVGQGAYMTYNININASSVDTSANTGKAIKNALEAYFRTGGTLNTRGPLKTGYKF